MCKWVTIVLKFVQVHVQKIISLINYITSVLRQCSKSLKTNAAFKKKSTAMDGKLVAQKKKTLLNLLFAPPHTLMSVIYPDFNPARFDQIGEVTGLSFPLKFSGLEWDPMFSYSVFWYGMVPLQIAVKMLFVTIKTDGNPLSCSLDSADGTPPVDLSSSRDSSRAQQKCRNVLSQLMKLSSSLSLPSHAARLYTRL